MVPSRPAIAEPYRDCHKNAGLGGGGRNDDASRPGNKQRQAATSSGTAASSSAKPSNHHDTILDPLRSSGHQYQLVELASWLGALTAAEYLTAAVVAVKTASGRVLEG